MTTPSNTADRVSASGTGSRRRYRKTGRTYAVAKREADYEREQFKFEIAKLKAQIQGLKNSVAALQQMRIPEMKIPTVNQGLHGGMQVNCENPPVQQDWEDLAQVINIHLRNRYNGPVI